MSLFEWARNIIVNLFGQKQVEEKKEVIHTWHKEKKQRKRRTRVGKSTREWKSTSNSAQNTVLKLQSILNMTAPVYVSRPWNYSPDIYTIPISFNEKKTPSPTLKLHARLLIKDRQYDEEIERMRMEYLNKPIYPILTNESVLLARNLIYQTPNSTIIAENFRISISGADIKTLRDKAWLNDEIINYIGALIEQNAVVNSHFFSSFFYTLLSSGGYERVRAWGRKKDLFSLDLCFFPVHLGVHWCCGAIKFKEKRIEYYDSMHGSPGPFFKNIRMYLENEHVDKKKTPIDLHEWTDYYNQKQIPRQLNSYDCGVFTCAFMHHLALDMDMKFNQSHMSYWRQKLALEIYNKRLLI